MRCIDLFLIEVDIEIVIQFNKLHKVFLADDLVKHLKCKRLNLVEFLLCHIGNHTLHDLADASGKFMRRTILRLGKQRFAQAFHQSFLVGDGGFQFRNLVFHAFQTILVGCNALREKANSFKVGRSIYSGQSLADLFADLIIFLRSLFLLRDGFNQLRRVYFSKILCSYNIADNLAFLFLRQIVDRGEAF